jgi:arylsulfatase A-like enzyme
MKKRPNIIFIVLDSLRADHVSCYGYERNTTPNIDRIAEEGAIFRNAISPGIATAEVHASWFTGLYLSEHGVHSGNRRYISDSLKCLPSLLQESGYDTAGFSCNPFVSKFKGMDRGFSTFKDPDKFDAEWSNKFLDRAINRFLKSVHFGYLEYSKKYRAEKMSEAMMDWFKNRKGDDPFFMFSIFIDTHIPHHPPLRYRRKYLREDISESMLEKLNSDPVKILSGEVSLNGHEYELLKDLYDANIAFVDGQLQRLFRLLDGSGVLDNTVLIITADHGDQFGEHGLFGHSLSLYDTLLKVPLIIRYPDQISPGLSCTKQVQTIDLFTTILEIGGVETEVHNNGRRGTNLIDYAKNDSDFDIPAYAEQGRWNRKELLGHPFNNKKWCIRTNSHKYIKADSGNNELYALETDPKERVNLISKDLPEKEILSKKLDEIISGLIEQKTSGAEESGDIDESIEGRLKALGYL